MVAAISAAVRGDDSLQRPAVFAHLMGLVIGASAVVIPLGLVGGALDLRSGWALAVVAAAALAWGVSSVLGRPLPRPSSSRQVPFSWRRYPPLKAAFAWGVGLGIGFLTRVSSSNYYIMLALVTVWGGWAPALVAAVAYGLARGVPVVLTVPAALAPEDHALRIDEWSATAYVLDAAVLVLGGLALMSLAAALHW
jgi:hypothetical protein